MPAIGTQVDHAAGYALESQSLGPTVVQPGLVQVQVALGPGIQAAAQIGQDVVGTAADITGTTGDGQIPGGDAAFLHLHALVAHKLHIGAGADLPGDIQGRILHPGQIDAACPGVLLLLAFRVTFPPFSWRVTGCCRTVRLVSFQVRSPALAWDRIWRFSSLFRSA